MAVSQEKDGRYWGKPPDDATAIQELERLRKTGAGFIVFTWSTFWWFEYYGELHRYLCSHFPCIQQGERIVVFDLRTHLKMNLTKPTRGYDEDP